MAAILTSQLNLSWLTTLATELFEYNSQKGKCFNNRQPVWMQPHWRVRFGGHWLALKWANKAQSVQKSSSKLCAFDGCILTVCGDSAGRGCGCLMTHDLLFKATWQAHRGTDFTTLHLNLQIIHICSNQVSCKKNTLNHQLPAIPVLNALIVRKYHSQQSHSTGLSWSQRRENRYTKSEGTALSAALLTVQTALRTLQAG